MAIAPAIKDKLTVLDDFGLTDKAKLQAYLEKEMENCPEAKYNTRLDNICRNLITDFFNGNRTYVKKGKKKNEENN